MVRKHAQTLLGLLGFSKKARLLCSLPENRFNLNSTITTDEWDQNLDLPGQPGPRQTCHADCASFNFWAARPSFGVFHLLSGLHWTRSDRLPSNRGSHFGSCHSQGFPIQDFSSSSAVFSRRRVLTNKREEVARTALVSFLFPEIAVGRGKWGSSHERQETCSS
jgi:hypothetical protein